MLAERFGQAVIEVARRILAAALQALVFTLARLDPTSGTVPARGRRNLVLADAPCTTRSLRIIDDVTEKTIITRRLTFCALLPSTRARFAYLIRHVGVLAGNAFDAGVILFVFLPSHRAHAA